MFAEAHTLLPTQCKRQRLFHRRRRRRRRRTILFTILLTQVQSSIGIEESYKFQHNLFLFDLCALDWRGTLLKYICAAQEPMQST